MNALRLVVLLAVASCAGTPVVADRALHSARGTLVARLVAEPLDPARHAATCKPWHQLFAPDGRQLTKDLGGEYEHHRGLFVGWNQVRCGDSRFDFWHCRQGESQRLLAHTVPPGRPHAQELAIAWCAANGQPIVAELRRVETITTDDVNGVRMTHELRAAAGAGAVTLGGDPQHAGAQFRAVQAFAEADAPKVAYVRPATATGGKDDVWTHCAWTAAVLPFADGPVTVLRVEHPDNPPATWSTRPYGRFGAMWTTTLEPEVPFRVQVAWLVLPGTADVACCERLAAAAFAQ